MLLAIFGRVIISWLVIAGMRNAFLFRLDLALSTVTAPLMRPIRRIIPTMGMFDFTPMVAISILLVIRSALASA